MKSDMESQDKYDFEHYSRNQGETTVANQLLSTKQDNVESIGGRLRHRRKESETIDVKRKAVPQHENSKELAGSSTVVEYSPLPGNLVITNHHEAWTPIETSSTSNEDSVLGDPFYTSDGESSDLSDSELGALGEEMSKQRFAYHIDQWRQALEAEDWTLVAEHAEVLRQNKSIDVERSRAIVLSSPLILELVRGDATKAREMVETLQRAGSHRFPNFNLIKTITLIKTKDLESAKRSCNRLIRQLRQGDNNSPDLRIAFALMTRILKLNNKTAEAMWFDSQCNAMSENHYFVESADILDTSWVNFALDYNSRPMKPAMEILLPRFLGPQLANSAVLTTGTSGFLIDYFQTAFAESVQLQKRIHPEVLSLIAAPCTNILSDTRTHILQTIANCLDHPDCEAAVDAIIRSIDSTSTAAGLGSNKIKGFGEKWIQKPMEIAVEKENLQFIEAICKWEGVFGDDIYQGKQVSVKINGWPLAPIQYALRKACSSKDNHKMVEFMLKMGASTYFEGAWSTIWSPLVSAIQNEKVTEDNFSIPQTLIDAGAAVLPTIDLPSFPAGRPQEVYQKVVKRIAAAGK